MLGFLLLVPHDLDDEGHEPEDQWFYPSGKEDGGIPANTIIIKIACGTCVSTSNGHLYKEPPWLEDKPHKNDSGQEPQPCRWDAALNAREEEETQGNTRNYHKVCAR